jgi:pimeloyl-ACP methyl ester carboxylesterase
VRRLALLLPAGVVNGSAWAGLTRVFLPLARYRLRPTDRNRRRLYDGLFTHWDDVWGPWLGDAMRDFALDLRIPPLATPAELSRYTGPALVFGADEDVSFPGAKLVARAKVLLPQAESELLVGCKHGPPTTPEFRQKLAARLAGFFG